MKKRIQRFLSHPKDSLRFHLLRIPFLPDRIRILIMWNKWMNYPLNLKHPKTFSEKLQWLKLYDHNPLYTRLVDKYAVKEYVAEIIGEKYVIPTLAVWDNVEDIDLSILPDKFVLKTTHDSGGVCICRDKTTFNFAKVKEKLNRSLRFDYYKLAAEWPYKNVPHRIIAEQYIEPEPNVIDLPDYKWYCFNGEPKFCQVIQDRSTEETIDFFDIEWNLQEFIGMNPKAKHARETPARPKNLDEQIKIANELSKGLIFSRIDLYETRCGTLFGEITFYPTSGLGCFSPIRYNEILGSMLRLPGEK